MLKKWLQTATDAVASVKIGNARVIEDVDAVIGMPDPVDEPVTQPTAPRRMSVPRPKPAQKLDLIVVPQSALDAIDTAPHLLCESVVGYVNHLLRVGQFTREELPAEALQIFHLDYYYAQVCNGGHAQFVGNSQAILALTLQDIMSGMMQMGHDGYHKIAADLTAWVTTNPAEAQQQTGFEGGIAPALAALDAPFLAIDNAEPFANLLADWIADLEIVLAVPDDQVPQVLAGIVKMNDKADERETARDIHRFDHMLSDPLQLGLSHAGGSIKDPVIAIGGGTQMQVRGNDMTCWMVATSGGKRWGIMNDSGAALLDSNAAPGVGDLIASVSQEEINVARQVASQTKAAVAIELMLGRLDAALKVDFLSVRSAGRGKDGQNGATIYVVVNNASAAFSAVVTSDGAKLLEEPSHDVLVTVTRAEIDAHAAEYCMPMAA